jgi:hypothetical protein
MWSATAEVEQFDEAVGWFKNRLPITTSDLAKYGAKARDKAFWITGVAQLDIVAEVHASILDALKKGTPFEEWQKSVSSKLAKAWGEEKAWRVETIYRNATQQAYITGRLEQLRDPVVLKLRPFWVYIAIDDGRCPTGVCPKCNGTTLPPDHHWWLTHTPQNHHSCRCRIDAVSKATAKERGGETAEPTDVMASEGFGTPPDLQTVEDFKKPIKKRIVEKVHPELVQEFERKQVAEAPKPPPVPKKNPDHDPARWEPYFKQQGYDAKSAKALAHGRAMQERGLDMSLDDVFKAIKPYTDMDSMGPLKVAIVYLNTKRFHFGVQTAREVLAASKGMQSHVEAIVALAAHAESLGKVRADATFNIASPTSAALLEYAKTGAGFYAVFAAKSYTFNNVDIDFDTGHAVYVGDKNRAYYDKDGGYNEARRRNWINAGKPPNNAVITHELGHCLEAQNKQAAERAAAFLKARTKGEIAQMMSVLKPGLAYADHEVAKPDKFIDPYMGKIYASASTEITSMTAEMLARDPSRLKRDDPDSFWWILGQLADVH